MDRSIGLNRLEKVEMNPHIAGNLRYLACILLKVLEGAEIADRLTNLEDRIRNLAEGSRLAESCGSWKG